jgi:acyl-CoA reductase-like NAD-dependent aldehyde dehydrogenase
MSLKLRVGLVHLNHAAYITSEFPSGGIKDSGFGSSSYSDGLTNLSNRKSIVNKVW